MFMTSALQPVIAQYTSLKTRVTKVDHDHKSTSFTVFMCVCSGHCGHSGRLAH